mmetsp:Transcript_43739/g.114958  ORF Transcript_43739/g.114958 Transcript_43739/m.114958 type:complete len:208 (-) Transcript_43739:736-1359(-)
MAPMRVSRRGSPHCIQKMFNWIHACGLMIVSSLHSGKNSLANSQSVHGKGGRMQLKRRSFVLVKRPAVGRHLVSCQDHKLEVDPCRVLTIDAHVKVRLQEWIGTALVIHGVRGAAFHTHTPSCQDKAQGLQQHRQLTIKIIHSPADQPSRSWRHRHVTRVTNRPNLSTRYSSRMSTHINPASRWLMINWQRMRSTFIRKTRTATWRT